MTLATKSQSTDVLRTPRPLVKFCMEWIPSYREAFYAQLRPILDARGIDMEVLHGSPPASRRARKDSVAPPWATFVPNKEIAVKGTEVTWQPVFHASKDADLIIVQNEAALPFTYLAMAHRRIGGPLVAMWGHGEHFNEAEANPAAEAVKRRVAPHVDWFFAYTQRSADIVAGHGLPPDRISVVNNSRNSDANLVHEGKVDDELKALLADVRARASHVGWMVSALDEWKRLPFLVDTLDEIRSRIPEFEFFVLGQGDDTTIVNAASSRPWLHALGSRFGADKAAVGELADVTIQPGLIGLHAIDAFAFATPMVTTEHPVHSHEFDYLVDGENALVLPAGSTAAELGAFTAELLSDSDRLARLQAGCEASARVYTIEHMVERFADGIEAALALRS